MIGLKALDEAQFVLQRDVSAGERLCPHISLDEFLCGRDVQIIVGGADWVFVELFRASDVVGEGLVLPVTLDCCLQLVRHF